MGTNFQETAHDEYRLCFTTKKQKALFDRLLNAAKGVDSWELEDEAAGDALLRELDDIHTKVFLSNCNKREEILSFVTEMYNHIIGW